MIDILMIVLVALALALLLRSLPLKKHVEEVEQCKREEQRARDMREKMIIDREIEQAQRKYDEAYHNAKVSYQKLKDTLERERAREEMRDSVSPQANRRLRHLMID